MPPSRLRTGGSGPGFRRRYRRGRKVGGTFKSAAQKDPGWRKAFNRTKDVVRPWKRRSRSGGWFLISPTGGQTLTEIEKVSNQLAI